MADDYQFDDLDAESSVPAENEAEKAVTAEDSALAEPATDTQTSSGSAGGGNYASELFSKQIKAKFRTFFIDLKESSNGKFVKISEKSHGRKSTIMMDAEDVPVFIEALKEVSEKL